jgi:hypothetical protein
LDLPGTRGNAKSLQKHDGERQGILVAPSKRPHFSGSFDSVPISVFFDVLKSKVGFGPKSRGTDGKPTTITAACIALQSRQSEKDSSGSNSIGVT